jgi:hypothetical protein
MPYPPTIRSGWVPIVAILATSNPTINSFYDDGVNYICEVKNNDSALATIKVEINDSTPDLYSQDVAAGRPYTFTIAHGLYAPPFTVYATAQASGKSISAVVSYFYNP